MACLEETKLWEETDKVYDHWIKSKTIERWGLTEDKAAFQSIFESATDKPFVEGADITAMDMQKMLVSVKDFEYSLKKPGLISNKFFKAMYVGRRKASKNIILQRFYDEIINANEYRNKNTQNLMSDYNNMIKDVQSALYEYNGIDTKKLANHWTEYFNPSKVVNNLKNRKAQKAWDTLNALEKSYVKKRYAGESAASEFSNLKDFLKDEGVIFADIVERIESGSDAFLYKRHADASSPNKVDFTKRNYIKLVNNVASHWTNIERRSRGELTNSISKLVDTINMKYGNTSNRAKFLINEYKEISSLIEKTGEGYMPHFVLNIFETGMGLAEKLSEVAPENVTQLDKVISEYTTKVSTIKTGLADRLKKKSKTPDEYFSRNPMLYASKYVEQVTRFNHRTHLDRAFTVGLKDLTKVIFRNPGTAEFKAATTYKRVLEDMYTKATGTKTVADSPTADNMVRLITALQFTSKLGWSTRGAGRNMMQRLWNAQWFGVKAIYEASSEIGKNKDYKAAMMKELNNHGLAFIDIANITDGAVTATDMIASNVNVEKGHITFRESETFLEKATKAGVKLADKSAWLTKQVENSNRKSTFQVSFHKRVQELKNSTAFSDWNSDPKVSEHMYKLAGNYAAKMTSLIHFEYSKTGKADFLTTKKGMIAGQFMHYAMSLADLQAKMIGDYSRAVRAGDYTGKELGRIVKTAMVINISNALSAFLDVNFTSYINNDTVERLGGLVRLMRGDETAFYGKGLVGASGIVPLNDMIELYNIGAAYGLYQLHVDPEGKAAWLTGIKEMDPMTGGEAAMSVFRIASIEGGRLVNSTLPALGYENPFWAVIRAELGVWGGKTGMGVNTKTYRKALEESDFFKKVFNKKDTPKPVSPSKFKKGFGKKTIKGFSSTQTRSQENNAEALKSLDLLA